MPNTETTPVAQELRWLADSYEQVQRLRIACGERIRAVLQGRDDTWSADVVLETKEEVVQALKEIAAGKMPGPVPILGRSYQRYWVEERDLFKDMMAAWTGHPAYPWLNRVKGISATYGTRLLGRLDIHKAPHASSFWKYCGLATVPGHEYRCGKCGRAQGFPVGYSVSGNHQTNKHQPCSGKYVLVAGPEDGIRVAMPEPASGQLAPYDQTAKKIMYQIGTSFIKLKVPGAYEAVYREHRARLELERPGWADGRKHQTALRITEKLFLAHLWTIWRQAEGLPVEFPYAQAVLEHTGYIDPWEMVD